MPSQIIEFTELELKTKALVALPPAHRQDILAELGEELFSGAAAVLHKVLTRGDQWLDGAWLMQAATGTKATATVSVTWASGSTLAHTVSADQPLFKSADGLRYFLDEDLIIGASQPPTTVVVSVYAERKSFDYNLPSGEITGMIVEDLTFPGTDIQFSAATTTPAKSEFITGVLAGDISVTASSAATGGVTGTLDLLGQGRGLPRQNSESDTAYQDRVRPIPEGVSPAAIKRAVDAFLVPFGLVCTIVEPWDGGAFAFAEDPEGAFEDADGGWTGAKPYFIVTIPTLGYSASGFAFEDDPQGNFEDDPGGMGVTENQNAGVYTAARAIVDRLRAGGVGFDVFEEV
jgi:hypothetical protein